MEQNTDELLDDILFVKCSYFMYNLFDYVSVKLIEKGIPQTYDIRQKIFSHLMTNIIFLTTYYLRDINIEFSDIETKMHVIVEECVRKVKMLQERDGTEH